MKLAIMQPYFFPYLGYWQLFSYADAFVVFDVVPFRKRSWMSRNRILHPDPQKEFSYINLPVSVDKSKLIRDALVDIDEGWYKSLLGSFGVYQRMHAPYYAEVSSLVEFASKVKEKAFAKYIRSTIESVLKLTRIDCTLHLASELDMDFSDIEAPGDWALRICNAMNADLYVNPPGGAAIFDEQQYRAHGIKLEFLKSNLSPYAQGQRASFTPGLSILDVLMFCGADGVHQMLKQDYKIVSKTDLISNTKAN